MTIKERYRNILEYFRKNFPEPETELNYKNPFGLIVAVILSAQCTDKRVNIIAPALLKKYPDAETMSVAETGEIFEYIKSCSYPNSKARYLSGMSRMIVSRFGGIVPSEPDLLQLLPGVGRKTANVIASVVFGKKVIAVDTHVFRVSKRTGLIRNANTPLSAEIQLTANIPVDMINKAHHWLLLHGRYVCKAKKPLCYQCGISDYCKYFSETGKKK
jgi:endonuclease III